MPKVTQQIQALGRELKTAADRARRVRVEISKTPRPTTQVATVLLPTRSLRSMLREQKL